MMKEKTIPRVQKKDKNMQNNCQREHQSILPPKKNPFSLEDLEVFAT